MQKPSIPTWLWLGLASLFGVGSSFASQPNPTSPPAATSAFVAPGGLAAASPATRAGWNVSPRDYCSVCGDGNAHSVASVLGVSTLAALAATAASDGSHPFAFAASYPFGVLFNLVPEAPAANGATTLTFQTTGQIGIQVPVTAAASSGATSVVVGDLAVTADQTAIANGTPLGGTGIANGTTVNATPSGYSGYWTLTLSSATTANISASSYLSAYVRPAAGSYALPILWTSGINVGDLVTDAGGCVASGTQVDYVNDAKGEIYVSKPTTAQCPAQDTLTFIPSWLSKVAAGMTVQGPVGVVANGTTVAGVNLSTGVVTLSQALTGAIAAATPLLNNAAPATGQPVTFYRPFSDTEAASLEMDGLALQAAINATQNSTSGGAAPIPSRTLWRLSAPLVLPLQSQYGNAQKPVSLGGAADSPMGAELLPVADFGPDSAAVSCGDPTAKSSNQRGVYQTSAATIWCSGELHDVTIAPATGFAQTYGLRPTWSGTPVAMDGVKEGTRLNWSRVSVSGFRYGAQAEIDHTRIADSQLDNNFGGWRMDDLATNVHGDDVFDRLYASGNSLCDLCVSPAAYFSGHMFKPYLSSAPYSIYCEPGVSALSCVQGTVIESLNAENMTCGFIQDGGVQDGVMGRGSARSLVEVTEINDFHYNAVPGWSTVPPAWGCQWHSWYDMGYIQGLDIQGVQTGEFPQIANAQAYIARVQRLDGFQSAGLGGLRVSGDGVYTMIQRAAGYGQNVVSSFGGFTAGAFWYTAGWRQISLVGPGFTARPIPFYDTGASTLPLGALVEWGTSTVDNVATVQRAGKTAGAAFAGVSIQNWTSYNPNSQGIAPVIAVSGSDVPFLTTSAATAGEMLIPDTTNLGQSVSTSTAYGSPPAAGLLYAAGSAGVNYGQVLQSRP